MFPERVGRLVLDAPVDLSAHQRGRPRRRPPPVRARARRLPRPTARTTASASSDRAATPLAALTKLQQPVRAGPDAARLPRRRTAFGASGRGRVLHRCPLRALRQAVRVAGPRRRARGRRSTGTARCCSPSPTATTVAATNGTYDNIGESSGDHRVRRPARPDGVASSRTSPSTTEPPASSRSSVATPPTCPSGATRRLPTPAASELLGDVRVSASHAGSHRGHHRRSGDAVLRRAGPGWPDRGFATPDVREHRAHRRTRRAPASTVPSTVTCSTDAFPAWARAANG